MLRPLAESSSRRETFTDKHVVPLQRIKRVFACSRDRKYCQSVLQSLCNPASSQSALKCYSDVHTYSMSSRANFLKGINSAKIGKQQVSSRADCRPLIAMLLRKRDRILHPSIENFAKLRLHQHRRSGAATPW